MNGKAQEECSNRKMKRMSIERKINNKCQYLPRTFLRLNNCCFSFFSSLCSEWNQYFMSISLLTGFLSNAVKEKDKLNLRHFRAFNWIILDRTLVVNLIFLRFLKCFMLQILKREKKNEAITIRFFVVLVQS